MLYFFEYDIDEYDMSKHPFRSVFAFQIYLRRFSNFEIRFENQFEILKLCKSRLPEPCSIACGMALSMVHHIPSTEIPRSSWPR